ncbi:MAG TPA: hypothetical protein PK825_00155 [Bacteroidales bacterium]|nr:hypothetical protein [Bacteroidales bacterium]
MKEKHFEVPLVLVTALVAGSLLWPARRELIYIAFVLGILAILFPFFRKYLTLLWFKLAEGIGAIVSKIILGILFFVILVPLSLITGIWLKDPLRLKKPTRSAFYKRFYIWEKKDMVDLW